MLNNQKQFWEYIVFRLDVRSGFEDIAGMTRFPVAY